MTGLPDRVAWLQGFGYVVWMRRVEWAGRVARGGWAGWARVPRWVRVGVGEVLIVAATLASVLLSYPPPPAYAVPTAVVACVLLPVRLKWAWAAGLLCLVSLIGSLGLAPTVVALYRIGRTGSVRSAVLWAAAAVLALEVPVLLRTPAPLADDLLGVTFSVLTVIAPVALGALITTRARLAESLAELRDAREAELAAREDEARARERARVGREIHDAVGHHAVLLAVEAAATSATTTQPETREFADRVRELAKQSLAEMRAALGLLGDSRAAAPPVPADPPHEAPASAAWAEPEVPAPGLAEVPGLVRRAGRSGVDVVLADETGGADGLGPVAGRAVFRIVQESLTNAAKHAPGAPVTVHLTRDGAQFLVTVTTGPGFAADPPAGPDSGGLGLAGLAERARTAGGVLEVDRGPGEFSVRARLPLGGTPRK